MMLVISTTQTICSLQASNLDFFYIVMIIKYFISIHNIWTNIDQIRFLKFPSKCLKILLGNFPNSSWDLRYLIGQKPTQNAHRSMKILRSKTYHICFILQARWRTELIAMACRTRTHDLWTIILNIIVRHIHYGLSACHVARFLSV
jgi:hypothetical protein